MKVAVDSGGNESVVRPKRAVGYLPERVSHMEINPNRNVSPVTPIVSASRAKATGASAAIGGASFEQSTWLSSALAAVSDTRSQVVARAERLVASAAYPPPEVINRIANLLAANLITQDN
jgi:hypothetical protein